MDPVAPIRGEQPQIDWPTITLGDQSLVVRWSFYVQWLLSKRRVSLKDLGKLLASGEPAMVDTLLECFAAAVAENFTARNQVVPSAEHWAIQISGLPNPMTLWKSCCESIFMAIAKMGPAAPPVPQDAVPTTGEVQPAKTVN